MSDNPFELVTYSDNTLTVGDIITVNGKRFKVEKKTTTAVAVTRYYWWDRLWDRLTKRLWDRLTK